MSTLLPDVDPFITVMDGSSSAIRSYPQALDPCQFGLTECILIPALCGANQSRAWIDSFHWLASGTQSTNLQLALWEDITMMLNFGWRRRLHVGCHVGTNMATNTFTQAATQLASSSSCNILQETQKLCKTDTDCFSNWNLFDTFVTMPDLLWSFVGHSKQALLRTVFPSSIAKISLPFERSGKCKIFPPDCWTQQRSIRDFWLHNMTSCASKVRSRNSFLYFRCGGGKITQKLLLIGDK